MTNISKRKYILVIAIALASIWLGAIAESYMKFRSSGWRFDNVVIGDPSRIPDADPEGWKSLRRGMSRLEVADALGGAPVKQPRLELEGIKGYHIPEQWEYGWSHSRSVGTSPYSHVVTFGPEGKLDSWEPQGEPAPIWLRLGFARRRTPWWVVAACDGGTGRMCLGWLGFGLMFLGWKLKHRAIAEREDALKPE